MTAKFHPRWILPYLKQTVKETPVTVLTGARQVGKTTLLQQEFQEGWRYYTLDDQEILHQLSKDPSIILESKSHIILDEVQRYPKIFPIIKHLVDQNRERRFILSGSANLLLMEQVSESLAGRAFFMDLEPLGQGEIENLPLSEWLTHLLNQEFHKLEKTYPLCSDLPLWTWRGGMPVVLSRKTPESLTQWRDGYITTYLERDLKILSQIENLYDFRRLMTSAALRSGQLLNISSLARDIGLKQPTAHRYINLLEVSGLVHRVPSYANNRGLRLVKTPKLLWTDSGIASHLAGHYSSEDLLESREWGGMVESYLFTQIKLLADLQIPKAHLYHWRTQNQHEVDLVIEQGQKLIAIEIKASSRYTLQDTQGLQEFLRHYPHAKAGVLLYAGTKTERLGKNLLVLPISSLWA